MAMLGSCPLFCLADPVPAPESVRVDFARRQLTRFDMFL